VCLDEDRALLRRFLAWLDVRPPRRVARLLVDEQRLPGEAEGSDEAEAERRGLPDLLIHDGDGWAVIVESKVQAGLPRDQLHRHVATLRRRGFDRTKVLCLTKHGVAPPRGVLGRTWSELYQWLGAGARPGSWASRLRAYLRAAETRFVQEAYMTEGTLTTFDGFHFGHRNPYSYGEAKRLLKLARDELVRDRRLVRLGLDPEGPGRGAITGVSGSGVWDVLPLRMGLGRQPFTAVPHLTLTVEREEVAAAVTIPNGVSPTVRRQLAALGAGGLDRLRRQILVRARPLVRRGAVVRAYAVQRRFPNRGSAGIEVARVRFTLHTPVRGGGPVTYDPRWAGFFADLLARKRGNVQFGYVVALPHGMRGLASRRSLDLLIQAWWSLEPVLRILRQPGSAGRRGAVRGRPAQGPRGRAVPGRARAR
jgi:hypothetical protein